MKPIRHLLVPVDFSPISRGAFAYALYIARQTGASITLLNSYLADFGLPMPNVATLQLLEARKENSRLYLQKMLEESNLQGVSVVQRSEMGIPWDVIQKTAKEEAVDAIVIGTKGEHNAAEVLFGSVTTHVLQHAPCPVWVVPEGVQAKPIRHIAYATALSDDNSDTVADVIELARHFNSEVHCVHVNTNPLNDKLEAATFEEFIQVKDSSVPVSFTQIEHDNVREGLEQFVKDQGIDVLALLRPQRGLLERIFHRSQTRNFALHTDIPLYVFRH